MWWVIHYHRWYVSICFVVSLLVSLGSTWTLYQLSSVGTVCNNPTKKKMRGLYVSSHSMVLDSAILWGFFCDSRLYAFLEELLPTFVVLMGLPPLLSKYALSSLIYSPFPYCHWRIHRTIPPLSLKQNPLLHSKAFLPSHIKTKYIMGGVIYILTQPVHS